MFYFHKHRDPDVTFKSIEIKILNITNYMG